MSLPHFYYELRFRVRAQRHEVSPFRDAKYRFAQSFIFPVARNKMDSAI